MSNIHTLTEFLGWCTVINFGLLGISMISLMALRRWVGRIHSSMFNISEEDLSRFYFQYLANFKLIVIVFNLVPYFALKVMA